MAWALLLAAVGLDLPLIDDKLGLRSTGNLSFTDLLFRINGHRDEFTTTPRGYDGNLNLIYEYSPTGRLRVLQLRRWRATWSAGCSAFL